MTGQPSNPWGDRDWTPYYEAVAGKEPRETLIRAIEILDPSAGPRCAIDLGAGEGRDTRLLLAHGMRVLALDPHPAAGDRIRAGLDRASLDRMTVVRAGAEDLSGVLDAHPAFALPAVVNASFSLPFVRPEIFARAWGVIAGLVRGGAVFAGQFFGPRDTWATNPTRSHHTRGEVEGLFSGLRVHVLREDEKDGFDAEGRAKHWHVFHVVAGRGEPAGGSGR
ncbi:MAG: class I SAM-dependent methyltransferase [Phycisphaeraceae bacterium]|nr:MAG: class I SAM-dependent methyltransferase [Phycisphaeraceae bacterium]